MAQSINGDEDPLPQVWNLHRQLFSRIQQIETRLLPGQTAISSLAFTSDWLYYALNPTANRPPP